MVQDGYEVHYARNLIRAYRGGGWSGDTVACRAAERVAFHPQLRSGDLGFRVAADPSGLLSKSEGR